MPPVSPYLPAGLLLPYYARADLAYQQTFYDGAITPGFVYAVEPEDGTVMVVPFLHATGTTSATVANRFLILQYVDASGATLWAIVSNLSQPANTSFSFTGVSSPGISGGATNQVIIYMPPTVFMPGDKLYVTAANWQTGDQFTGLNISKLLIPTGPEQPGAAVPPVAISFA